MRCVWQRGWAGPRDRVDVGGDVGVKDRSGMIEWTDEGMILSVRRHGETAAIVELFTHGKGRHAGVVRGGAGRRMAPVLQPGAQVRAVWRARLEDHLGHFAVEPLRSRAGLMADALALAGLDAITALLAFVLPEREAHPALYARSLALLDMLGNDGWLIEYLAWELALLDEAGVGLDLTRCAVTGTRDDLAYVSPRTGRAVSPAGAGDWADRLLPLPRGLVDRDAEISPRDLRDGFRLTGYFLETHLAPSIGDRPVPPARARLMARIARHFET